MVQKGKIGPPEAAQLFSSGRSNLSVSVCLPLFRVRKRGEAKKKSFIFAVFLAGPTRLGKSGRWLVARFPNMNFRELLFRQSDFFIFLHFSATSYTPIFALENVHFAYLILNKSVSVFISVVCFSKLSCLVNNKISF